MQRLCRQLSAKEGFTGAVSTLALTRGLRERGRLNPHTMGNTERAPVLDGAMTGTRYVGRTSPSNTSGRFRWVVKRCVRGERSAVSMIGRSSGDEPR